MQLKGHLLVAGQVVSAVCDLIYQLCSLCCLSAALSEATKRLWQFGCINLSPPAPGCYHSWSAKRGSNISDPATFTLNEKAAGAPAFWSTDWSVQAWCCWGLTMVHPSSLFPDHNVTWWSSRNFNDSMPNTWMEANSLEFKRDTWVEPISSRCEAAGAAWLPSTTAASLFTIYGAVDSGRFVCTREHQIV